MPVVETRSGKVRGVREDGVDVFRGLPFAQPPVGERRFRAPEPVEPWSGVRAGERFGPAAPQNASGLDVLPGMEVGEQAEDCLYLNVYTPAADGGRRPVLVWIHGGAFVIGAASQLLYDGRPLARRGDVVVVTINYRLGALGFLHLGDLCGDGIGTEPNAGILDQVAALEWVRDNIERFGGDPGNVTVFGESAGGMSVGTLLALPAARGLYRRAIPQSGAGHHAATREVATEVATRLLAGLGLSARDAARLREVPVPRLLEAQASLMLSLQQDPIPNSMALSFGPVVDGRTLPALPIEAIRGGSARDVDVLVGTTRDEWKLFAPMDPGLGTLDRDGLVARLRARLPAAAPAGSAEHLVEAYRKAREGRRGAEPPELFTAIETDRVFRVPAIRLAEAQLGSAGGHRVHKYLFTWESPMLGGAFGACHALELPFVFGTCDEVAQFCGEGPEVRALSERVMDAWLGFARAGEPGWPAYDLERRSTMELGRDSGPRNAPFDAERSAWDGIL